MDILDKKTDEELLKSLLAEVAKASNELRCSLGDVQKAQTRLNFVLVLTNTLIERKRD
jgi:hypothetical protein